MNKESAKDVEGFLLYNQFTEKFWFRRYADEPDGRKTFKDYEIRHYDIKVKIIDGGAFFEDGETRYIDYDIPRDENGRMLPGNAKARPKSENKETET